MHLTNAAKLCDERGFPWTLILRNGAIRFEIETSDGVYELSTGRDAVEAQAGRGNINGDVLAMILRDHEPARDLRAPRDKPRQQSWHGRR